MSRIDRRDLLKAMGAASIAGIAGCSGGGGGGGGDSSGDDSSGGDSGSEETEMETTAPSSNPDYHIGMLTFSMGNAWFQCFARSGQWYAQQNNIKFTISDGEISTSKQTTDARNMLNSGVDALIMSAVDSDAAANIVEMANEEGVPVFSASAATNSENIPLYVGFGNRRAARRSTEALMDLLPKENGEPTGRVAEVMIEQNTFLGRARHEGFQEVVSQYDNVEVAASVLTQNSAQEAQTKVTNLLQSDSEIDGFHAQAITTGNGTIQALDNANMLVPKEEDDHVYLTQIDAGPQPNQYISDGFIDYCTDQPVQFIAPIAVKYMKDYLDSDAPDGSDWLGNPDVLPAVGDEITSDDLSIGGNLPQEQFGVDIWQNPVWAPSPIVEHPEFPLRAWFQLASVEVTPDNADAPWLWGNWINDALS
jgi:ABC-type sugar transport system substrate-binding protein